MIFAGRPRHLLRTTAAAILAARVSSGRAPSEDRSARISAAVRERWDRLDWAAPIPAALVIPEVHYMDMAPLGLTDPQRVRLNRLLACFTCELFIHFEGYVIAYLGRWPRRIAQLPPPLVTRFIAEEQVHAEMFHRLLHKLRPDLYAPGADAPLRFLRWSPADDLALRLSPPGTFFLLAWLFEEITLMMPRILDATPAECSALLAAVMRLHADEERPHVAIDERVMSTIITRGPRWRVGANTALALPLLAYVGAKVQRAWSGFVARADGELALTARQRRLLRGRGPSLSDRLGIASFTDKMDRSALTGAPLLCWALRRELRRGAP